MRHHLTLISKQGKQGKVRRAQGYSRFSRMIICNLSRTAARHWSSSFLFKFLPLSFFQTGYILI